MLVGHGEAARRNLVSDTNCKCRRATRAALKLQMKPATWLKTPTPRSIVNTSGRLVPDWYASPANFMEELVGIVLARRAVAAGRETKLLKVSQPDAPTLALHRPFYHTFATCTGQITLHPGHLAIGALLCHDDVALRSLDDRPAALRL